MNLRSNEDDMRIKKYLIEVFAEPVLQFLKVPCFRLRNSKRVIRESNEKITMP